MGAGYTKLMKEYNDLKAKFEAKFELNRNLLIKLAKPYTTTIVIAYKWVENEVAETALFVYRYHKLGERYNNGRELINSEIERLTPILKNNFKKYNAEIRQYVK